MNYVAVIPVTVSKQCMVYDLKTTSYPPYVYVRNIITKWCKTYLLFLIFNMRLSTYCVFTNNFFFVPDNSFEIYSAIVAPKRKHFNETNNSHLNNPFFVPNIDNMIRYYLILTYLHSINAASTFGSEKKLIESHLRDDRMCKFQYIPLVLFPFTQPHAIRVKCSSNCYFFSVFVRFIQ